MQEFDVSTEKSVGEYAGDETYQQKMARFQELLKYLSKRLLVFVSFGPGVLGLLWLIGRLFTKK